MNPAIMVGLTVVLVAGAALAFKRFDSMKKLSVADLRAYFRPGGDWLFYNRAVHELRRRGESIDNALVPTLALLVDESSNKRIAGWLVLQRHFPDMAKRLDGYQPTGDVDAFRQRVYDPLTDDQLAILAGYHINTPPSMMDALSSRRNASD